MTKSIYPTQHFFQGSAVQEQTDSQLNIRIEPQEREITQEETEEAEEQSKPTELAEQPFTPEEQQLSEQLYQAQQRENYCERQTERFERLSKYSLDEGNVREYKARTREWEERLEKVKQSVNNLKNSIAKSAESGIINTEYVLARKERNTGAFSELEIPMQKRYVLYLCQKYGIDTNGIKFKIQRSEELVNLGYFGMTDYDNIGRIDLLPNAFRNEEQLLRTIIHEKCHVKQLKKYGKKYVQDNLDEMERVAYKFEDFYYSIVKRRTNL